jgi:hypothetical protein
MVDKTAGKTAVLSVAYLAQKKVGLLVVGKVEK